MTKLQRLKARLIAAGLTVDDVRLQNVGPERVPIMDALQVDTNYLGPYPPAETFEKVATVRKICGKRFFVRAGWSHTGVIIREFTPGEV